MLFTSHRRGERPDLGRLVAVVRPFDHRSRQALYAAANAGVLRRHTWSGCALNRATELLCRPSTNEEAAAEVLAVKRRVVARFVRVWDELRGSDEDCTALLRDAILEAGLFPPNEVAPRTAVLEPPVANAPQRT